MISSIGELAVARNTVLTRRRILSTSFHPWMNSSRERIANGRPPIARAFTRSSCSACAIRHTTSLWRRQLLDSTMGTRKRPTFTFQQSQRSKATVTRPDAMGSTSTTTKSSSWINDLSDFLRRQRTIAIPRWVTPGHQTMSISEVFGHSSFVLVALSYAVDDFLMLRCIAVVGSTAMLVFTYFQ